jgi:hypothetical protein
MPIRQNRPLRRSGRLCALIVSCAVLGALSLPASAGAYEEHFCQYVGLASGTNCYASNRHSLDLVRGWVISGPGNRICVASFAYPGTSQNSPWMCDYGSVSTPPGADGVGAVRNSSQSWMTVYGIQYF